jgi:SAM-dependent methyltransferase
LSRQDELLPVFFGVKIAAMDVERYTDLNLALWESRLEHHLRSDFYALEDFKCGATSLNEIELALMGDLRGREVVHLQCHFGQDTLSLSRMGAHATGIDFSPKAIDTARSLARELSLDAQFVCADVHEAPGCLSKPADMVFTTYGVLGWMPDMTRWARVVADCLKPGGELLLVEFHPVIWMYDNGFVRPAYSYFNGAPIIETEEGTYADSSAPIFLTSVGWNHSIGEVFGALRAAGMDVVHLAEYDYSPYPAFKDSVPAGDRRWQIKGMEGLLPMVYSLKAIKQK